MALPTSGSLTLSQIATEFGGSTPHSLSEYYAGGGLVAPGTKGYPGSVETPIPSSGTISIQNFYGASAAVIIGNGFNITLSGNTSLQVATLTFLSTGSISRSGGATGTPSSWFTGTVDDTYYIRLTSVPPLIGTASGMAFNTWYALTSDRAITLTDLANGEIAELHATVEFAKGTTSNIVSTGTLDMGTGDAD